MPESFNKETELTVEKAKYNYEVCLAEYVEAARAMGEFEVGREDRGDFGFSEILDEKRNDLNEAFTAYIAALEREATAKGVAKRQSELMV